jgi:hypothetical protein
MMLVDEDRRRAIDGELSLSQLEAAYAFQIPQDRCIESGEIEPFRYTEDDEIIQQMESKSVPLGAFCESHRGVELNKAGHVIQCPGCGVWMPPPRGSDPDDEKTCPECNLEFERQNRMAEEYLVSPDPDDGDVMYMDGDSYRGRYQPLELMGLDLGYDGISYKDESVYRGEKVFIRQAGVGLSVAYENELVYCPQSVYVYKIREDREEIVDWYHGDDDYDSWTAPENIPSDLSTEQYHKFLLGVLSSRVFHYYVFKRFGEIDAAQAFAKLTQTKIRSLPIPIGELSTERGRELASRVAERVEEMLQEDNVLGGSKDWQIERSILELYGLSPEDMAYINKQMGLVAYHQTMQQLYPEGPPPKPERKERIALSNGG